MIRKLLEVCRKNLILFAVCNIFLGLAIGFGLGVYTLPILTAESGLDDKTIAELEQTAERRGVFRRDLEGSDALHWGDGIIMVNDKAVWLDGSVSPGPDYRLYLAPAFVETEADFIDIKAQSVEVGSIKAFTNFRLAVPAHVNAANFPAVVIWCEAFSQFITAAALSS